MTLDKENTCTEFLEPAFDLVAQAGIGALSLRPLAAAAGTTVSVLTYRFGRKEHLLEQLVDMAHEQEQAFLDGWRRRIEPLADLRGRDVADIADGLFDELAGAQARRSLFFSELVQAGAWDAGLRPALARWLETRLDFWRLLCSRLSAAPPVDLADLLHGYAIDETAFGLALNGLPAYRWLRRLNLRRLCAPADDQAAEQQLFRVFLDELAELPDSVAIDRGARAQGGRKGEMVRHIAALIVEQGAEAVTHRAVSKAAGVGVSTLSHHFRRQEDLLRAGLEEIIRQMWAQIERPPGMPDPAGEPAARPAPIWRATFAIALAATRNPDLVPSAAAMRRRRGENADRVLARIGLNRRYDRLAAQAISIIYMGQMMLADRQESRDAEGDLYRLIDAVDGWIGTKQ